MVPPIISENGKVQNKNAKNCHFCGDFFNESDGNYKIIPKAEDKYISYSFEKIQFKDIFSLMASSLDNLVKTPRNDKDDSKK